MDNYEKSLLLTVARIMRARLCAELPPDANRDEHGDLLDDIWALRDALQPFDPTPHPPVNEANDFYGRGEHMPGVTD